MIDNEISQLCVDVANVKFVDANKFEYFAQLDAEKMGKYYSTNQGFIAFQTKDAKYYVSPFVTELIPLLEALGFEEGPVIQPFSNGAVAIDPYVAMKLHNLTENKKSRDNNLSSGRSL